MNRLLIVDDNLKVAKSLESILGIDGYICDCATTSDEAMTLIKENKPDVVLLDIMLGSENGIDCLKKIKKDFINLPVIMITGYGTIENAVLSMKLGAFDFIQKPFNFEHLKQIINNAIKLIELKKENDSLHDLIANVGPKPIYISSSMKDLYTRAYNIALTDLPVFITGETGTGKELLADYIHINSVRRNKPFNKINCAAFPESLLDNELFGHEKGSFTGASNQFKGIFERSDEGSLLLDEIGDMPLAIQAKILRVLQNSEIRRIGGSEIIKLNVRFIAATNKDLENLIKEGMFREDLYYRLNAITLKIPPLRERIDDIPLLAEHFIKEFSASSYLNKKTFSQEAFQAIVSYDWPGNIRELKNVVMYACAISKENIIKLSDLPDTIVRNTTNSIKAQISGNNFTLPKYHQFDSKYGLDPRSAAEAEIIKSVLIQCNYNKKKCAEILRISRNTLYRKLSQYGIIEPENLK